MSVSDAICQSGQRRQDVRDAALFGFDYVEFSQNPPTLDVFFLGRAPQGIEKANVRLTGGRKIRDIVVTGIKVIRQRDPTLDDYMEVSVDKAGDFSLYTLSLVVLDDRGYPTDTLLAGFDPLYATVEFSFKIDCPNDQDCAPLQNCPPAARELPEINYLAKDYGSFRQLLLDRLALTLPGWRESHIPDIGIMLVELLAYAGDQLSYYQDAVATEAYLDTARHRISVRRHARLVDYALHEGCNARAFVTIATDTDAVLDPSQIYFCTAFRGMPPTRMLEPRDMAKAPAGGYECFSPMPQDPAAPIALVAAHSEIQFYTWGDCACCLPAGTIAATLTDRWIMPAVEKSAAEGAAPQEPPGASRALKLKAGDVLIFEEVIGPKTGNPADADPAHRQAVRLTKVTANIDPLYHPYSAAYGQPVVDIEWCSEDALKFPLCLSAQMPAPDCACRADISVARGNVILIDHGLPQDEALGSVASRSIAEQCPSDCAPGETLVVPARFHAILTGAPLSFSVPLDPCACVGRLIGQDPRQALPRVALTSTMRTAQGPAATDWSPRLHLLDSGPDDAHFVVEIDDAGLAHLRFGNGREGRMPEAGAEFQAHYAVGNGPAGNVGAETIRYIAFRQLTDGIGKLEPRNPLAASGGIAPEPIAEAKMFAPFAFRTVLERAITADDYATLAADNDRRLVERHAIFAAASAAVSPPPPLPGPEADDVRAALEEEPSEEETLAVAGCFVPFQRLQGAKGTLRWTGSWYEAQVAVDPLGSETAGAELLAEIDGFLEPYRRIGHDLSVKPASYVSLDVALSICVRADMLRGHVESTLLDVFSNRVLADGRLGFFHPDQLGFGGAVYASRIVAAAQAVQGVTEVRLLRLARLNPAAAPADANSAQVPANGVLALAPYEIARLDNDRSLAENGRLTLIMRGGR